MHFILDRIALAVTLMVVIPAAPAIAVLWGGWLIHQWLFNAPERADSVHRNSACTKQNPSRATARTSSSETRGPLAAELNLAA